MIATCVCGDGMKIPQTPPMLKPILYVHSRKGTTPLLRKETDEMGGPSFVLDLA